MRIVCGLWVLLASGCALLNPPEDFHPEVPAPVVRSSEGEGELWVGAAAVGITPLEPILLGGFGILRQSEGVHDALWARAVALRRGEVTAILIGVDSIGLHHHQVEDVRARLADVAPGAAILVAATHTHSAPDTMGLWGLPPLVSGIDPVYLERALAGIALAGRRAVEGLEPAVARWGRAEAPEVGISRNKREPETIDRRVTTWAFDRPDGTAIATLVHFACHPEALGSDNDVVSSDFPWALRETVEAARGGVAVYLNGPLGGMVTTEESESTFAEVERIGRTVGEVALGSLAEARLVEAGALQVAQHGMWVPVQNQRFHLGNLFGIFLGRPFDPAGYTPSEVQAIRLGDTVWVTVPGEALPRVGFEVSGAIATEVGVVVGLGNDELGYLIHESDWGDPRYDYEETVSAGPLATVLVRRTAWAALRSVGALRAEGEAGGR